MERIDSTNIKPTNVMTPTEIPAFLRKAADKELQAALDAGFLEPWFLR